MTASTPVPASATTPVVPDTDLSVPPGEDVEVVTDDGAVLSVRVCAPAAAVADAGPRGSGGRASPPVVLPHCWTGSRVVWVPVARRLVAAGHRVVLYDQRGHGGSTRGTAPISVERLGADLAAVMEHLDVRDAVLAGHSMGGMTVMALAGHRPEVVRARARGLVLVATAAHGLGGGPIGAAWSVATRRGLATRAMAHPRVGRALVRPVFGADAEPAHVEVTRELFAATPPAVCRECLEAMGAMDLREVLARIDVPAVVVLGRRDRLLVNALTRAIVDHVPGAELVELPRAGHMLPFERPDEVAAAIRRVAGDESGPDRDP